jgi:hypothetical protein
MRESADLDAIERQLHELAEQVRAVARRLELRQTSLALGGSFIGAATLLREALLGELGALITSHQFVPDPAIGAVVLARRLLE